MPRTSHAQNVTPRTFRGIRPGAVHVRDHLCHFVRVAVFLWVLRFALDVSIVFVDSVLALVMVATSCIVLNSVW